MCVCAYVYVCVDGECVCTYGQSEYVYVNFNVRYALSL